MKKRDFRARRVWKRRDNFERRVARGVGGKVHKTVLFKGTGEVPLFVLKDCCSKRVRTLWIGENFSAAGFSKKAFPGIVHPPLDLLDILFPKVAEATLKSQIVLDGNDLRFFLNCIGSPVLDLIKGEDS